MNAWAARSACTASCAVHRVPTVSTVEGSRRALALARTVTSALPRTRLGSGEQRAGKAREALRALDVTLDTDGEPLRAPGAAGTLIVANHVSWLDILALMAVSPEPVAFVAKREVGRWPVLGPLAARTGTRFVGRDSLWELPDAVAELADVLRGGESVMVFPAGTTWCRAPGGGFRRAMFQAAVDAGAPVRPVAIDYRQRGEHSTVAAFVGDDTFAASLGRVLRARELSVRVRPRPALEPGPDRRELARLAQHAVRGTREPCHA